MRNWLFLAALLLLRAETAKAGDYDFTIPEAEQKPFNFSGRLEGRYVLHLLDEDSTRYKLNYSQEEPGSTTDELHTTLELAGSYRQGNVQATLLSHHEYSDTYEESDSTNKLYEGYLSLTPSANLTVDAGKKLVLWGKGYAWNPVGFFNPAKDPDDPALNLEGQTQLGIDVIKSFAGGRLTNIGLTAMVLPVIDNWANPDMGDEGDINTAAKLYLLWRDTDLDFIYFDGPEQPASIGFDVARNLADNFEIHGELALQHDVTHIVLDQTGNTRKTEEDQLSYLLGMRYLNSYDTTFIAEYYHNGAGYDSDQLEDFFTFQETAFNQWLATADARFIQTASQDTRPYYQQRNFGEEYLYLKISQKEPFDMLYFTPWLAATVNLQDMSFNLQPGLTWTPITNLELNVRAGIPIGPAKTEFGEKADSFRPEVWLRYYF